ncbi:MAG: hypothetical protein LBS97_02885 [Treponema sp.]|nr:hypothetical protein [Treponema sp.]
MGQFGKATIRAVELYKSGEVSNPVEVWQKANLSENKTKLWTAIGNASISPNNEMDVVTALWNAGGDKMRTLVVKIIFCLLVFCASQTLKAQNWKRRETKDAWGDVSGYVQSVAMYINICWRLK